MVLQDSLFPRWLAAAHRLLFVWLFGDVVYAVIPLAVMALITGLLGKDFKDFLLLKEWSFASIIFFGVSTRRLIKFKVEVQRSPHGYRLDTGVQLNIVALIAAVLVLALVILVEMGVLARGITPTLARTQLVIFIIGGLGTLVTSWAFENAKTVWRTLPPEMPRAWVVETLAEDLKAAKDSLEHAVFANEKLSTIEYRPYERQDGRMHF